MVTALREHEIVLNGTKFPIEGNVRETLISRFPPKTTTGDYSYDNEQILSNWVINDQRGGMLIEEMDESIHADRYWWSNCDTRFRSSITLNPMATSITTTYTWTSPTSATDDASAWTDEAKIYDESLTTFGFDTDVAATTWSEYIQLNIASSEIGAVRYYIASDAVSVFTSQIDIDVYYSSGWHDVFQGAIQLGVWKVHVIEYAGVTAARVRLYNGDADPHNVELHEFDFGVKGTGSYSGTNYKWIEFNSQQYMVQDAILYRLNAGGDGYIPLKTFTVNPTDLVHDEADLYILLGDADEYWYMDTAEAFTECTDTDALNITKGIWWNDCLFAFDSAGACKYCAAPAATAVTFTANGTLPVADNELQELNNYFDADGNYIIYASTKVGTFAHDTTHALFLPTAIGGPSHQTGGKGAAVWHDALYVSSGLSVKKYVAGSTATSTTMGLDKDDGLPQYFSGEIVKFIARDDEFFALIDSTYEGTSSYSQVVSYDGQGWRVWYRSDTANKAMYSGFISSIYAYRLWWADGGGVHYITLQRASRNPKKVSGYTYAASGSHYSPRFDAGTKAFPKLATKLTLFLDDMSALNTVTPYYQIDQASNAIIGGSWTALGSAQTADGKVALTFGTGGIQFYDIQFDFDLVRAAGTSTNSPNIKAAVLSYVKLINRLKAWSFTINTAEAGMVSSKPKKLVDAINTIMATNTLMAFTFRDGSDTTDTHYVMIQPYYSFIPTGQNWEGKYELTCIEC